MESWQKWSPYALSVLRIIAALLFLEHALQKYLGFPSAGPPMSSLLWVQGAIEILGGILMLVGAWTRPIAFILCGNMAVAYFIAHFPKSFYPAINGGDAAILYCFVFLYRLRRRGTVERGRNFVAKSLTEVAPANGFPSWVATTFNWCAQLMSEDSCSAERGPSAFSARR
jgi:putative oxidoreductase